VTRSNSNLQQCVLSVRSEKQRFGNHSSIIRLSDSVGDDKSRLLLIHGYLNNDSAKADYRPMIQGARQGGWNGEIHGVVWDGGDPLAKIQAIAKKIAWSFIPVPGPHSVLIPIRLGYAGFQIHKYWADACKRSDETGKSLAAYLIRDQRDVGGLPWTVASHSLGCRVAYAAMHEAASLTGKPVFANVLLFGGAVSTKCDWQSSAFSVEQNTVNCFSQNDRVLQFFFQLAQWRSPIGLNSIPSDHPKLCNHDCTEAVPDHFAYYNSFRKVLASIVGEQ